MLAERMRTSSPGPSGSSTSTTLTPGGVDLTAFIVRTPLAVSRQDVVVGIRRDRPLPVLQQRERPILCDAPELVLVPAVDGRPPPCHLTVFGVHAFVERVVHVLADLERAMVCPQQQLETSED